MTNEELGSTIDAIWRIESARVIARVVRLTNDLSLAEDYAQDALLTALEIWPAKGLPDNPGAWLMTAAKRRALDHLRHQTMAASKHVELARDMDAQNALAQQAFVERIDTSADGDIDDDVLRLIFTACHPVLSPDARAALTLKVVGGFSTQEIARAYLKSEPTIAQRIVRAKRTLAEVHVPFEMPRGVELAPRLASVLEVVYLFFNEGYAATSGNHWTCPELCDEALRLGRKLASLMPQEAEVHGLAALMEIQASRLNARVDSRGHPILLPDQDRSQWDQLLIRRGLAALTRAESLPGAFGPYTLQAAIAACHARAATYEETDWLKIAAVYEALAQVAPSPVVALNRAVAVGMAFGPAEGLELVDALLTEPTLIQYHLLPSVRGDLLARLDRVHEARTEFERAAALTCNGRERALLLARAAACTSAMIAGVPDSHPGKASP